MKKDTKSLLWGLAAGSVIGSITALLFAPKPGKELRKDIAEGTAASLEKIQETAVQVSDKSVEIYGKAKDTVEQVVCDVRDWGKQITDAGTEDNKLAVSGIAAVEAAVALVNAIREAEDTAVAVSAERTSGGNTQDDLKKDESI
ncbi:general stress protein [Paenibacillus albidus]|uniref:General stress protein n=1 Tax=Paenibacillus albidus TaxID=2041023 RepID=A0A917FUP2_9BACL|nr:YtxH domain-containing protein [Paenibacillus albidus]GGG10584.1 general stress protein [Paenibacillus albidus]